jgi:hypothetical protein
VDKITVNEISVDEMTVDEMSVDEMSVDAISWCPINSKRKVNNNTYSKTPF